MEGSFQPQLLWHEFSGCRASDYWIYFGCNGVERDSFVISACLVVPDADLCCRHFI